MGFNGDALRARDLKRLNALQGTLGGDEFSQEPVKEHQNVGLRAEWA
jgi:hypothetical protein